MTDSHEQLKKLSPEQRALLLLRLKKQKEQGAKKAEKAIVRQGRDSYEFPLSFAQQRIWFLEQFEKDSVEYNFALAFSLEGQLNVNAFEKSINDIVKRHETLRTTFKKVDGQPIQVISPARTIPLNKFDLTHLPKDEQTEKIKQFAEEEAASPFDLIKGPLIRVSLLQLEDEAHVFFLSIHHIVFDGWSRAIFNSELSALYEANVDGTAAELPDLAIQYADFSFWQTRLFNKVQLAGQLGYWQNRLAGAPPVVSFPTDKARARSPKAVASAETFSIDPDLGSKLKQLCRHSNTTLFMAVFAAFSILLSRYSGSRDVVIGLPMVDRGHRETEDLIGLFLNTIALRIDFTAQPSFHQLLDQVKQVSKEALDNQDIPFQKLVEELHPERSLLYTPVFQVMFNLQSAPKEGVELTGLEVTPLKFRNSLPGTNYDLMFSFTDDEEGVRGVAEYNVDLYDPTTISRMIRNFQVLLEGCVDNPEDSIDAIPMLSGEEEHQILTLWNQTSTDYPLDVTLQQLFEAQVDITPEATALEFCEQTLSYLELDERANRVAHFLRENGVGPGKLVGVYMERSLEMVVTLCGILKSGGAYVPMDPEYPTERIAFMVDETQVPVLLSQEHLRKRLPPNNSKVVCVDTQWDVIANKSGSRIAGVTTAEDPAYVIYTSGSTGRPKGVINCHKGIVNHLLWMKATYPLREDDTVLQKTPYSFDVSVWEIFWPLVAGARLVLAQPGGHKDPMYLAKLIEDKKITTLHFVASMLKSYLKHAPLSAAKCLKRVISSGEALSYELQEQFFEASSAQLINLYGPTEAAVHVTRWDCQQGDGRLVVPIGRPIANTRIYILDPHMRPVPIGVPGELHIGGMQVAQGYLNRPELTAEKFIADPFSGDVKARLYKTGDRVRYRADGNIEYIGRIDYQVKLRGFRIELGEIESVLADHEAVQDVVLMAREDEPGDKRLVAYVVAEVGEPDGPSVKDLRTLARTKLPDYMIPSAFVVLDCFPLTSSGKLDRRALPVPDGERQATEAFVEPRSNLEGRLAEIWRDLLGLEKVGVRDNFFDLGGHSLLLSQVQARLTEEFECKVAMIDFFQYPTIESLSRHLGGGSEQTSAIEKARARVGEADVSAAHGHEDAIAIIGMAGRFPGAATIEDFWDNLENGVESIRFFSDEELRAAGISEALIADPHFVPAKGCLDEADLFDAAFFGYPPREAELIDPQQRIFLECAWEALERAGCDPARYPGLIGVYAGSTTNRYSHSLHSHPEIVQASGSMQISIGNNKDFLPTRTSYKLNLRGPSVNVQTACSTSLVAIHEACKSLLERECDMALAGGISVLSSRVEGYMYQEESILSPDGHCKAFSSDARGTVHGEGVGILVLKRLSEAKQDGDNIHAVIRGTAINNDGSNKVGYTAPSVEGQADAIALAQAAARVSADSIGYIETHGTGTVLGDPIEIAALSHVFGDSRDDRGSRCAIGAVKTNVGHLDAAAGVAGVIKTALSLKHGRIPPSLNYREPNPEIDFESSPFYVNTELKRWETTDDTPRRAGVSSFGIGGTNAHAVLEQAPLLKASEQGREWQLLPISAKNETVMEQSKNRIADYLERNPDVSLADVSYTLRTGRGQFECRAAAIGVDNASAVAALRGLQAGRSWSNHDVAGSPSVIFMFPGQGSQYARMGRDLYETETVFREIVDHCCTHLLRHIDVDLRDIIFARSADDSEAVDAQLRQTLMAQCSLFVIEYALARLWMSWGIRPAAMIGHSIGEYVAACIAGVIDLDAALALIARRGQAMAQAPAGSMLSVPLPEQQTLHYLNDDLWLSVINAHSTSVVSGTLEAIDELEQRLQSDGIEPLRLQTSGAFHSGLMDGVVPQLVDEAKKLNISPAAIPYISNVTGTWIEAVQLEDPQYWGQHLRNTVRFAEGVDVLLEKFETGIFLEVGPGKTLASMLRQAAAEADTDVEILSSLRHPREQLVDDETVAGALAGLWLRGVDIDWQGYDQHSRRCRVELPTYPFQRQSYWVELASEPATSGLARVRQPMEDWFYVPLWKSSVPLKPRATNNIQGRWLLFCNGAVASLEITEWLRAQECETTCVFAGNSFTRHENGDYTIDPRSADDYRLLTEGLEQGSGPPQHVIYLWSLTVAVGDERRSDSVYEPLDMCYHSLIYLAQALGKSGSSDTVDIIVVSNGMHTVLKDESLNPEKATLLGPCAVIGKEYPNMSCRNVDIGISQAQRDIETLMAEILHPTDDMVLAYRDGQRWIRIYEAVKLDAPNREALPIRPGGVYLITGGLGGIGLALASYLAREYQANLVLTGRSELPPREQWSDSLARENGAANPTVERIKAIQALEEMGARVLVLQADVADRDRMREVLDLARQAFGAINGVIHSAGLPGGRVIQLQSAETAAAVMAPKVDGTRVLGELLDPLELDFVVLCSSLSSVLGVAAQVDYCSANAFQDAWAEYYAAKSGIPVISINWDTWNESGMAVNTLQEMGRDISDLIGKGFNNDEGIEVFRRILAGATVPQVAVSTYELSARMPRRVSDIHAEKDAELEAETTETSFATAKQYERPELSCPFEEARTPSQFQLAEIWKWLFKLDRIGIHDDFFELGGDSLLAIRVIAEIREKFDTSLSIEKLFELSTIDKLASHLEALEWIKYDAKEKIAGDETRKEFEL